MRSKLLIGVLVSSAFLSFAKANEVSPKKIDIFLAHSIPALEVVNTNLFNSISTINYVDDFDEYSKLLTESIPPFNEKKETIDQYKQRAIEFAKDWSASHREEIQHNSDIINYIVQKNITSVPAIVINDSHVIYGVTLSQAVSDWRKTVHDTNRSKGLSK